MVAGGVAWLMGRGMVAEGEFRSTGEGLGGVEVCSCGTWTWGPSGWTDGTVKRLTGICRGCWCGLGWYRQVGVGKGKRYPVVATTLVEEVG